MTRGTAVAFAGKHGHHSANPTQRVPSDPDRPQLSRSSLRLQAAPDRGDAASGPRQPHPRRPSARATADLPTSPHPGPRGGGPTTAASPWPGRRHLRSLLTPARRHRAPRTPPRASGDRHPGPAAAHPRGRPGLSEPVITPAWSRPPTVQAGLADPATSAATPAWSRPPTVQAGLADPDTIDSCHA